MYGVAIGRAYRMNNLDRYKARRPLMQTGDMLTWQSATALGWLIQKFSGSDRNHVGMVIRFRQYDQNRVFTLEALEGGIVLRTLSNRLENHKGKCWWHPLDPVHNDKRHEMGRIALSFVDKKYDYGSLFRQALGRVSVDLNRLFCSEYCQVVPTQAGVMEPQKLALQPKHYPSQVWLLQDRRIL